MKRTTARSCTKFYLQTYFCKSIDCMITIVRRSKKRVSVFQWILATALFTVSCTTDVWNETEDDANAICFQAPQTESRAAVEGSSLPAKSSFLVWGGYDNNVTKRCTKGIFFSVCVVFIGKRSENLHNSLICEIIRISTHE